MEEDQKDNDLFFVCSLIEHIARKTKNNKKYVVEKLGKENIKKIYGGRAFSLFIKPPSIDALRQRLENRGTDSQEVIQQRINRAEFELSQAPNFDACIVNDVLQKAQEEAANAIRRYLETAAE